MYSVILNLILEVFVKIEHSDKPLMKDALMLTWSPQSHCSPLSLSTSPSPHWPAPLASRQPVMVPVLSTADTLLAVHGEIASLLVCTPAILL